MEEFTKKNGAHSYIAISVKDYENLSKNFSELRRYIRTTKKKIILYYEKRCQRRKQMEQMIDIAIDFASNMAVYCSWYTNCSRFYYQYVWC